MHSIKVLICFVIIIAVFLYPTGKNFDLLDYFVNIATEFPEFPLPTTVPEFPELDWSIDFSITGINSEAENFGIWNLGSYLSRVFGDIMNIFRNIWHIIETVGTFIFDSTYWIVEVVQWIVKVLGLVFGGVFTIFEPSSGGVSA